MIDPFQTELTPIEDIIKNIRTLEELNNLPEYPNLHKEDITEIVRYQNWILDGNYI